MLDDFDLIVCYGFLERRLRLFRRSIAIYLFIQSKITLVLELSLEGFLVLLNDAFFDRI